MYINKYLTALAFTLISLFVFAQQETYPGDKKVGNQLQGQPTLTIADLKYTDVKKQNVFTSINPNVSIHFGFDDDKNNLTEYKKIYSCEVKLRITPYNNSNQQQSTYTDKDGHIVTYPVITLKIKHDNVTKGIQFDDYAVYNLPGIHKADVKIESITYYNEAGVVTVIDNSTASLQLKFTTDRYYNLQLSSTQFSSVLPLEYKFIKYNATQGVQVNNVSAGAEEIVLSWHKDAIAPAVEYELEWTWIDNFAENGGKLSVNEIPLTESDFKLNSTRVQTKELSYKIPIVYSKGYIIYRVRPVGRFLDDISKNYYGIWSSGLTNTYKFASNWPHYIEIDQNHELGKKNWQYQSSFAEDGKKKEVVSYFDGSLRNRQTVTKINSNNKAVVGEVIYDNQGRAAIEVLPVPVESSGIHFYSGLNKNSNGTSLFTHNDFDWDKENEKQCAATPVSAMANTAGASKYYSGNNAVQNSFQDLVPDAGLLPFSQIEYTPDNTGRVKSKGGVGKDHQIGTGHEMRYFYGTPNQEELNRLFGYKVGDYSHYKKNTVIDPNNQISVSYLDPQGRTIATALAGDKQGNLISLEDEANAALHLRTTKNLLANNDKYATGNNSMAQDGIHLSNTVTLIKEDDIKFNYTLKKDIGSYNDSCLTNKYYPFVYDWSISMTNDCASQLLYGLSGAPLTSKIGTFSLNSFQPSILNIGSVFEAKEQKKDNTYKFLSIGNYNLSKNIQIDTEALNGYADDYITQLKNGTTCKPDLTAFNDVIQITDCNVTCRSCEEALVTSNLENVSYKQAYIALLPTDLNSLGNTTNREPYIAVAETKYVNTNLPNISLTPTEIITYTQHYKSEFRALIAGCRELCQQPVNLCNINEETLLSDVSPNGQYGSIVGLEGEADSAQRNSDIDPLSVFNENNQFLYGGYKNITDTDPDNPAATISLKVSKYNWRYPSAGHYKDENGDISRIRIVKGEDNTYIPALRPLKGETIIPTIDDPASDDPNVVLAEPQYLNDIADFLAAWQPGWAKSLLPYHPEYQYFLYNMAICQKVDATGTNSDGFDEKLRDLEYYKIETNEIVDNSFFTAGGKLDQLLNIQNTNDPFYISAYPIENAAEFTLRRNIMKEALESNFDGLTFANSQGIAVKMNMLQTAYYFAAFSNGLVRPADYQGVLSQSNSSLLNTINTLSDPYLKQRIWSNFKGYYIALKEKTRTVFGHIYASRKQSNNSCIGDDKNTDSYVTLFKKYTANYAGITALIDSALSIQPIIPAGSDGVEPICLDQTSPLYINKQKRFVPADFSYDSGLSDQEVMASAKAKANANLFLETGKCPLALDVETFLIGLVDKKIQPNGLLINTFAYSMPYLTSGIFNAQVNPGFSLNSAQESPKIIGRLNGSDLNIDFTLQGSSIATPISLKFVNIAASYKNPCGTNAAIPQWADVVSFKNFYYIPGSYNPIDKTYKFRILAGIVRKGAVSGCTTPEEVLVEGTTKAAIGECYFTGSSGTGEVISFENTQCNKKELFSAGLKDLVLNLQKNNSLTTTQIITNNTIFNTGYLKTYFGVATGNEVKWNYEVVADQRIFSITVNDIPRIKLNAGNINTSIGEIKDLFIGDLQSDGKSNVVRVTVKKHIGWLYRLDAKSWSIASGKPKPLYFACCGACGEWDYNGDGQGDICGDPLSPPLLNICTLNKADETEYEENLKNVLNEIILNKSFFALQNSFNNPKAIKMSDFIVKSKLIEHYQAFRNYYINLNTYPDTYTFPIDLNTFYVLLRDDSNLIQIQFSNKNSLRDASTSLYIPNPSKIKEFNSIDIVGDDIVNVVYTDINNLLITANGIAIVNSVIINPSKVASNGFCTFFSNNYPVKNQVQATMISNESDIHVFTIDSQGVIVDYPKSISNKSINLSLSAVQSQFSAPTCNQICVPPTIAPVVCGDKWNEFKTGLHAKLPNYLIPAKLNDDGNFFCQANYGYISSDYLVYLNKFNIMTVQNPLFLTIAEFGSTKLKYGNTATQSVINSYYNYIQSQNINTSTEVKGWIEFANQYVINNNICAPATLAPGFSMELPVTPGAKTPCEIYSNAVKSTNIQQISDAFYADKKEAFKQNYLKAALEGLNETLTQTTIDKEYQYTLYYYDQAGNLIQTVPPQGIDRLLPSVDTAIDNIRNTQPENELNLINAVKVAPTHKMQTQYRYNSLNQLVWQQTPDGGETRFAYDELGRIAASQNASQKGKLLLSYTRYDALGRITEAGQFKTKTGMSLSINDNGRLETSGKELVSVDAVDKTVNYPYNITTETEQVSKTIYDNPVKDTQGWFTSYGADNSHKRVTAVLYYNIFTSQTLLGAYGNGIFYDYDVHGNVKELISHINNNAELKNLKKDITKIVYDYDLISGNVNKVTYQPNNTKDQFIHRYQYDADNRIQQVYTSKDNIIWEKEANYLYYDHGPLARVEIGDKSVQGLDYIYTLQGWLKGVNSERLGAQYDAGKDGLNVAQDAFGFALNYYKGDYSSRFNTRDASVFSFSKQQNLEQSNSLFNGNIKEMVTSLLDHNQKTIPTQYNYYKYDQLNRIKEMSSLSISYNQNLSTNTPIGSYLSNYSYDRNGNLGTLNRWAPLANGSIAAMDQLTYNYTAGTNKLTYVKDVIANAVFTNGLANDTSLDIDNQDPANYDYDNIGQLVSDKQQGLQIDWRADGKVKSVTKNNGTVISFEYDGLGNRIAKTVTAGTNSTITYYQRDAQGNVLSTYEMVKQGSVTKYYLVEQDIYGSSRIGVEKGRKEITAEQLTGTLGSGVSVLMAMAEPAVVVATASVSAQYGLNFKTPTASTIWIETPENSINLFDNLSQKTKTVTINTHLKIDSANDATKQLITALHGTVKEGESWPANGSSSFLSSVFLSVKKVDNGYLPVVSLVKYSRNHNKYTIVKGANKRTRYSYRNYKTINDYEIISPAIPENEWDIKAEITQGATNYNVVITINGNVYNTVSKLTTELNGEDENEVVGKDANSTDLLIALPKNNLGAATIDYFPGGASDKRAHTQYNALIAEMCDFSYSINNGQQPENLKVNKYSFDEGTGGFAGSPTGQIMTLRNLAYAETYCGSKDGDKDGDGVKDLMDNCPGTFNPKQEDDDHDGVGNVCDNCRNTANTNQLDADADGIGDVCDNCQNMANFDQIDTDKDGVGDVCDNCRTVNNPTQLDTNHNGIGDICEGLAQGQGNEATAGKPESFSRFVGDKQYELSNHLGNVLSVVSDRSLLTGSIFMPDVLSYSDYYPFGMLVPTRHGSSESYRYGFQGQEKDDELKGEGNSLNYTYRMHDPRIGRFFAPDPLESKYPFYSPYQFSGNRVIDMVELEGLEPAQPGTREGEKSWAFDNDAVENNTYSFSDLFTGDKLYGDWFWHAGTASTKADWYKTDDYKAVVMPFAVDMAKFAGWSYGTDWKSAKDLISNPSSLGGAMSERLKDFISSRVFDGSNGDALDMLTQIGASQINSANKAMASSATGAITPQEMDSPFFGVTFGLRAFATGGGEATGATVGISTSNNYKKTFFTAYPELEGQVVVHHAVEQQVLTRYNIFTKSEIHSLENLRGIPTELNSSLHLSDIRKEWNKFYRTNASPTKQMILDKATEVDNLFGSQFLPKK